MSRSKVNVLESQDRNRFHSHLRSEITEEVLVNLQEQSPSRIESAINRLDAGRSLDLETVALLLSPAAEGRLEWMAQKARGLSLNHFGKAVVLYTPVYLSNYCINACRYCAYGAEHEIKRRRLNSDEVEREALAVKAMGLKHVLLLSGESEQAYGFEDMMGAVDIFKRHFDAISLETYALTESEYRQANDNGVYGVTLYQETYNQNRYEELHPYGPKADYLYRLESPDRIGKAGMRAMNIGVLMGLADWRQDVLSLIIHGRYLMHHFPGMALSLSLPRIKDFEGAALEQLGLTNIGDVSYVQAMTVLRLALPQAAINVSTRESHDFRKWLLPIGVNYMSAGVSTAVGGHSLGADQGGGQFDIEDDSSVEAIMTMIKSAGYQPVLRDWIPF